MKKTTLLFLGLTMISFNAFAQNDFMFNDFAADNAAESVFESRSANKETSEKSIAVHALMEEDGNYLSTIEEKQKNITIMQMQLKEQELEYKVIEQNMKLEELKNPKVIEEPKEVKVKEEAPVSIFDRMMPGNSQQMPPMMDVFETEAEVEAKAAPVMVKSIKGLQGNLKATLVSTDFGKSIVGEGDVLNNGFKVKAISDSSITLESPEGDIETVGITFAM